MPTRFTLDTAETTIKNKRPSPWRRYNLVVTLRKQLANSTQSLKQAAWTLRCCKGLKKGEISEGLMGE